VIRIKSFKNKSNKIISELHENINNLEKILDSIPDLVFLINSNGEILDLWTGKVENLILPREEALGKNISDILDQEQYKAFNENLQSVLQKDRAGSFQYSLEVNGEILYYEARMLALNSNSKDKDVIISVRDITQAKLNSLKVEKLSREYETIFSNVDNAIFLINYTNGELRYQRLNRFHEESTGLKTDDIKGKTPVEAFGEKLGEELTRKYNRCLEARKTITYEEVLELPSGSRIWLTKLSPVIINGQIEKIVGTSIDITDRKEQQDKIEYLSYHDKLTDLYNRAYFENEIDRLNDSRRLPITILVADLDNLKYVNDNYGHQAGDEYIKTAADMIQECIRNEDIAARIGGDEFAIILPETGKSGARAVYNRIKRMEQAYIDSENSSDEIVKVFSISVGYGVMTEKEESLEDAFKEADKMMYEHKKINKGEG